MAISSLRTVTGNLISLLTSQVVNRAITFVLYALVARYLGAFAFGQLSLALTLFFISQVLAEAGLRTLITREVAKDRAKTGQYLVNGSAIVVVSSLLSIAVTLVFVRLMQYAPETVAIIILLSLGVLPYALSAICESLFQAWERMHYITYANVPVNLAKVGLTLLLLQKGYSLQHLVLMLVASHVSILVIEWWLMLRYIIRPRVTIDLRFCLATARSTSTFLAITGITAIKVSLDVILLSILTSEAEVGLFNAATQLMIPVLLLYDNIMLSVFPLMCRRFEPNVQGLRQVSMTVIALLLVIGLPIAVGLSFLAEPVFLLIYGDKDFLLASQVLRILVWTLILRAFTAVLGRVLWASQQERVTLSIVAINAVAKLVLSLLLISHFGLIGAAVAALLIAVVDFLRHYMPVSRIFGKIPLLRLVWKPVVASTVMAAFLILARNQPILLIIPSAGVVYVVVLLALITWPEGGLRQFKAKYAYLWSN